LSELTTPRVTEFADTMLKTRSRALTRKILVSLRSLIDEAIRRGYAGHNPAKPVKLRASHDEIGEGDDVEMPTKDELRALLTTVSGKWRPLIITAAFSGMRASELRALDWAHVDLKGGLIRVRRRVDAWGTFGPPKSKAGKRDIPLPSIVVNTLREWRLACPKGDNNKLDLVFPSVTGGVLAHAVILKDVFYPLQVGAGVTKEVEGAKVAKYGLHALRHAAVSAWIEKKFSPKRIQILAGHSSIRVTFDIYGHLFEANDTDQEAMSEIEARLLS
jgi:integrase